jgi:HD-like signal output (HDOD) protein
VLAEIGRELRRETPDVQKIANLITHDVANSAMILKTVNSAFFGLDSKARSVQQAIAHLGSQRTATLLAGLLLRNAFADANNRALVRFWGMSTKLALSAAFLARELRVLDRDEAHTFGLFRDVGSAVLICKFGHGEAFADLAPGDGVSRLTVLEKERFGTDHAVIGAVLAKDWQLPEEMSEAILWHHADFVFDASERPISDAALRLIALGALCDKIVAVHMGIRSSPQRDRLTAKALDIIEVPESTFLGLETEAMAALGEIAGGAAATIRIHSLAG